MQRIALAAVLSIASLSAFAGQSCTDAPKSSWMSRSRSPPRSGHGLHHQKLDVEDNCYEVKGLDKDGKRLRPILAIRWTASW